MKTLCWLQLYSEYLAFTCLHLKRSFFCITTTVFGNNEINYGSDPGGNSLIDRTVFSLRNSYKIILGCRESSL